MVCAEIVSQRGLPADLNWALFEVIGNGAMGKLLGNFSVDTLCFSCVKGAVSRYTWLNFKTVFKLKLKVINKRVRISQPSPTKSKSNMDRRA